ncbi:hypothetical protein DSO57_1006786 [Entomophthora muscae]|uniref:Uncharacterized protein n=1 Tax=Entomophthora muscae TaxID=34485 RepID=A0ACC2S9F3_9FUNG|nr:hypothetical protein DSO57_1006786 [Entomophthora muscae]
MAAPTNEANPATFGIGREVFDIFGRGRHGHRGGSDSYDRDSYGRGRFGSDDPDVPISLTIDRFAHLNKRVLYEISTLYSL